jgi:hypothetical protein
MADLVAVVLLVAAGEVSSPTVVAMASAVRETLGAPVEVRESPTVPTDGDALAVEASARASAVAELLWEDPGHRRVRLRIHRARVEGWLERSVTFSPTDPPAERGRMLGFAVALVVPEHPEEPQGDPTAPPATAGAASPSPATPPLPTTPPSATTLPSPTSPPPASTPPSPANPPPARASAPAPASTSSPSATTPSPMEGAASPPTPVGSASGEGLADDGARASPGAGKKPKVGVDLLFAGTAGIGGNASGAGGAAGVHWFPLPLVSVRLGAAEQTGSLNQAEASVFTVGMTAGLALHPFEMSLDRPFGLTVRADYLLLRQSVSHFDSDDPAPVTRVRWLSGFDVVAEVGWQLTSEIGLVAGLGLQDVLAPTYIDVRGAQVETIPALRGVVEAGFCLRF